MAFCPRCGSQNPDGSRFCAECGTPTPVTTAPAQSAYTSPSRPQSSLAHPTYIPPQPTYTPPVHPQSSLAQPPRSEQTPPTYIPPQQTYAPPVQPVYTPPTPPAGWGEEKPKKKFPWGILIVLALLVVVVVGCLIADVETVPPTEAPSEIACYDITVWCSGTVADLTREQINRFNSENDLGIFFNAYIMDVSEGDAGSLMAADVAGGADLYCFAQDQTSRLMQAGALSTPEGAFRKFIGTNNDPASVRGASNSSAKICAYPMSNDNGYFMYYDKSIFSEEDVQSLETIIRRCQETGTYISFELNNGWYLSSFFFATGCYSQWTTDESGQFIAVDDTFCSDQGYIALQGIQKLLDSGCLRNSSLCNDFSTGSSVVVSGTWDYNTAASILGSDLGTADLPSFEVDGTSYHLGSFSGCKLMGVKPQSDPQKEEALHQLAMYLTSQVCQEERFLYASWGPSNREVQQSADVQSNPALSALYEQSFYTMPQGQIHSMWWDIVKQIPQELGNGTALWDVLINYQARLYALFG